MTSGAERAAKDKADRPRDEYVNVPKISQETLAEGGASFPPVSGRLGKNALAGSSSRLG